MKIIFMGNWNLGYIVLNNLLQRAIPVSMVVTNFDLDDQDIYRNRVYDLACQKDIAVYKSYRNILDYVERGDIAFSVAYGNEIFKTDILEKIKIYNFHPSYLPYYKGPSPIQWQIKNREEKWGMTCHVVDEGIDTGRILRRDNYIVNPEDTYQMALDKYNKHFSDFIVENIAGIIKKKKSGEEIETIENDTQGENYYPHLSISGHLWNSSINELADYFNRKRILCFAGNRAELGIMFPIILEMSRLYYVDLIVPDTYYISGLSDLEEKKNYIERHKYCVNFVKISVNEKEDIYFESLPNIYRKVFAYLKHQEHFPYQYAIVLGDRIESLGFALAAFYGKVPLVHMSGGDVAEVPYFDNNVRHCISKLASLHLPFSEESAATLEQMGEERGRICNIGNPSFDYGRLNLLLPKEQIEEEFHFGDEPCVVFTYHSGPMKSEEENLDEFKLCLQGVLDSEVGKIIVTFPNHDPGSEKVLDYIAMMPDTERMLVVKSLGTVKIQTILKNFKVIIVGNSSMGLLETAFYRCPALNIGDRQNERIRGCNVKDVAVNQQKITDILNDMIREYDNLKQESIRDQLLFGDGNAASRALEFLEKYKDVLPENMIVKKFVKKTG